MTLKHLLMLPVIACGLARLNVPSPVVEKVSLLTTPCFGSLRMRLLSNGGQMSNSAHVKSSTVVYTIPIPINSSPAL